MCNVLIVGKPGAGRRSFADYLYRTDLFSAGGGMPVDAWEEGLQVYTMDHVDVVENVYCSVGFGSDVSEAWMGGLDDFLKGRQVKKDDDVIPSNHCVHTMFYVVNGDGHSTESSEMAALKAICDRYALTASVVITHCDVGAEEQIAAIEGEAARHGLPAIRVCAVKDAKKAARKDGRDAGRRYGRAAAMRQILSASFMKVGRDLSVLVTEVTCAMLRGILPDIKRQVTKARMSYFKINTVHASLEEMQKYMQRKYIRAYRRDVLAKYRQYYHYLTDKHVSFVGMAELEDGMGEIRDTLRVFSVKGMAFEGIIEGSTSNRLIRSNSDGFAQMLVFLVKFVRMKNTLKKCFDIIIKQRLVMLEKQIELFERLGVEDGFILPRGADLD